MGDIGTKVAKLVMLAGGAVIGALLARWVDDLFVAQVHEQHKQSEYDRTRYAQGLTAAPLPPAGPPQTISQLPAEDDMQQYEPYEHE
jgi:hypothetical protein